MPSWKVLAITGSDAAVVLTGLQIEGGNVDVVYGCFVAFPFERVY